YFDVAKIHKHFDFINLAAFDFLTPERNPEEVDFSAPVYAPPITENSNRLPYNNVDFQISYWLSNLCPPQKLHLGIATYGRAWIMTADSLLT
ncbi:glycosyl hydrolase family 18 protein, partial [Streptococcus pyogenes]